MACQWYLTKMPPRGPLHLSSEDANYLLNYLCASCNDISSIIDHLRLAIQNQDQENNSVALVSIVIKEEEAEMLLDLLEPNDKIRDVVMKCLMTMRGN